MDRIIRCITNDGSIVVTAAETSDIVFTAQKLHKTSPSATAALGRQLHHLWGRSLKARRGLSLSE